MPCASFIFTLIPRKQAPKSMSNKVPASPKVAPYFVHKRSISQSSDDVGGVLSEAEPEGIPGYLVSTPSETNMLVVGGGSDNEVVDMLPSGANADEFGPRTVMVSTLWRWSLCGCGARSMVARVCALYFCTRQIASRTLVDTTTIPPSHYLLLVPAPPFIHTASNSRNRRTKQGCQRHQRRRHQLHRTGRPCR